MDVYAPYLLTAEGCALRLIRGTALFMFGGDMTGSARRPSQARPNQATKLFLSYNSHDREAVLKVRAHLPANEFDAFFDAEALDPGKPWIGVVDDAVRTASVVAVFLGRSGLGPWQMREMTFALDRQVRETGAPKLAVVPVLLPGCDVRDAPGLLITNTWIDLRAGLDLDALLLGLRRAVGKAPQVAAPRSDAICPFRGLNAFREQDASLFFGRDAFIDRLESATLRHPVVSVVGASGSGKSSVVQAGLLPRLRRRAPPDLTWEIVTFKPGVAPYHGLAAALVETWSEGTSVAERVIEAERIGAALEKGGGPARPLRRHGHKGQGR